MTWKSFGGIVEKDNNLYEQFNKLSFIQTASNKRTSLPNQDRDNENKNCPEKNQQTKVNFVRT